MTHRYQIGRKLVKSNEWNPGGGCASDGDNIRGGNKNTPQYDGAANIATICSLRSLEFCATSTGRAIECPIAEAFRQISDALFGHDLGLLSILGDPCGLKSTIGRIDWLGLVHHQVILIAICFIQQPRQIIGGALAES
jgi:hypothetical protein